MRRRLGAAAAVALGALLGAGPTAAVAHPQLVTATPQPGAIAPKAPQAVTLAFSEDAIARASSIRIRGTGGAVQVARVRPGALHGTLSAPLAKLRPGIYQVRWSAVGRDGHLVSGRFAFGVARPDGTPPPGAAGLSAGGSRGGHAAGPGAPATVARWLGLLGGSLLFGGALALAALRRRRVAISLPDAPGAIAIRLAGAAAVVLLWAAGQGALAAASAGERFDLGLLTASASGRLALARLALALAGPPVLLAVRRLPVAGALGALLLLTYALDGHAQEGAWALFALHGLAAGAWAGAVLALVALGPRGRVAWAPAARAIAPVAGGALAVLGMTGVLVALHEIDRSYFLRWSGYGQVVLAKAAILIVAAGLGGIGYLRARRMTGVGGRPRLAGGAAGAAPRALRLAAVGPRALRTEGALLGGALLLAALLAGLVPGRGRPLPAQEGTLLPGPAIATVLGSAGPLRLALAPARPGANTLSVIPSGHPKPLVATLRCACGAAPVRVALRRGSGVAWSAALSLPRSGTWTAELDGATAALPVGVPGAAGAAPRDLLAVADLSGPGAERCRAHVLGLELAVGRVNAEGGVDGGRKLAPLVLDSGGSRTRAAELARRALRRGAVALAGVCGAGGEAAVAQAAASGVPSIVGDPAVEPVAARDTFRLAADPGAAGVAVAQAIRQQVLPFSLPSARTIAVAVGRDTPGARFLAGLRKGLAGAGRQILVTTPGAAVHRLDRRRTAAVVLDAGDAAAPQLAARLARAGSLAPAPVFASERLLSERFVLAAGRLGRLGVVQGASTVTPLSRDALAVVRAIPALWPGERPSLDALRGYVTGLALREALRNGEGALAARLMRPAPFTDALAAPWRADAPAAGSPRLDLVVPRFLAATLIPPSQGGESFDGTWFSDGSWTRASTAAYGPSLRAPVPPLPSAGP